MAKRRETNIFSLSFLDVMSCGFGAVVLIFLIINHATEREVKVINQDLLAEIRLLDYQVQNGERDLVELREELEALLRRVSESDQKLIDTETSIDDSVDDLARLSENSMASIESLEELKSDIETREEELERLRALEAVNDGSRVRSVVGEGDRQYLTGMKIGGKNILIALDSSASMLDDNIVNVIRRRNMNDDRKRMSPKWQRAVRTVEWIAAQMPLDASFQIYGFNEEVESLLDQGLGEWVELGEGRDLDKALTNLKERIPQKGTSLIKLVDSINSLSPPPDNVYLIIDSLPTQGLRPPRRATVSGRERLDHFEDAINRMPAQVPVNVILFPMEGDPLASAAYWNLARTSGGSFLSPSRDWP
jgi:hypothetical protein